MVFYGIYRRNRRLRLQSTYGTCVFANGPPTVLLAVLPWIFTDLFRVTFLYIITSLTGGFLRYFLDLHFVYKFFTTQSWRLGSLRLCCRNNLYPTYIGLCSVTIQDKIPQHNNQFDRKFCSSSSINTYYKI